MVTWLAVGVGGALGSMARHGVNVLVLNFWPAGRFPIATLIVNVAGCCVFGVLAGLLSSGTIAMRPSWREFVFVGLLGGFTTFSTFGADVVALLRAGAFGPAVANVAVQVAAGIAGLYLGLIFTLKSS